MKKQTKYNAIGVMSGTSLDGVDVINCSFEHDKGVWKYEIDYCKTYPYPDWLYEALKQSQDLSGLDLSKLDVKYGSYLGTLIKSFIQFYDISPDFIASHGYTVFHEPYKGMTLQIGSGADIASVTGVKTVCDFRTTDVALGGQGAPLVPVGDKMLFGDYAACINLGGFSNISYEQSGNRIAFDICPVNFVLNNLSYKLGFEYDDKGSLSKSRNIIEELLSKLNRIDYYKQEPPKSLGREFVEKEVYPLFCDSYSTKDIMRTFVEHSAIQISKVIDSLSGDGVLITGGGAYNDFLIAQIRNKTDKNIIIPNSDLIDFKEALLFAFLGVLRLEGIPNCLSSVTGASKDNVGGAVYF